MSTHKHIDKICCVAVILSLLLTAVFMNGEQLGIQAASRIMGYESRLFDTSTVHSIDIVMDDWDSFIETCQSEEYSSCTILIDGEAYKNVGIRGKGNTSLSNVASMDSDRYSFKVEFDQYDSTMSYHGLDKLSLNNIIQDNTFMKDFLVYQMMGSFGVDAPLCSYAYITVNGEDWGLYLAVEGIEDSFLQRNYGNDYGELYKPDSMSFGGGRGNGKDFNMENFDFDFGSESASDFGSESEATPESGSQPETGESEGSMALPGGNMQMPGGGMNMPQGSMNMPEGTMQMPEGTMQMPEDMTLPEGTMQMPEDMTLPEGTMQMPEDMTLPEGMEELRESMKEFSGEMGRGGGFGGGMGSDDVKLQYIDDDPASYSNIFDNAKTDITEADQARLIASLKSLGSYENIEEIVNIEEVIRYFVVHNFVVNDDSYTGSMIHNYYLYEENGQLSMIPWDYNLAFGTFTGNNASSAVNDSIDFSDGSMEDRPMLNWIFEKEEYTELYYQYFAEFISECFESGSVTELIAQTTELIAPYVEKDPTKFCTYEEFELGAATLKEFCLLRAESVSAQLEGTDTTVDASSITLSDMGTMQMGGMGDFGGRGDMGNNMGGGMAFPGNMDDSFDPASMAGSFDPASMAGGFDSREK